MLWVGLTGGIASGKSKVAARLAELGAVVIDSDVLAREVVAAGTPGFCAVVEKFGTGVVASDGSLDRARLGAFVFADPEARAALEAIIHPRVFQRTQELKRAAAPDAIVVHDIPLLVELGREADYDLVVVVAASAAVRSQRLQHHRGMSPAEAEARIAAQATDEQRRRVADVWLTNEGTVQELIAAVDRLWNEQLLTYRASKSAGAKSDLS